MTTDSQVRLRNLLEHSRRATTYYALHLPSLSEPLPDDLDALLTRLPLLSRQDLRRHGGELRSRDGDTSSWRLLRTTGTTDEPAEVILDAEARAAEAAVLASHVDRCLGSQHWRDRNLLHLTLHAGAASRAMPSPWSALARVIKWNLLRTWQAGDAAFVHSLAHLHGQVVTALPSVAELLAARLQTACPAEPIRPLLILLSGQTTEPQTRALVADAFGCPVSTLYTLAEAGIVGTECLTDGDYHVEEAVVVEVLDETGNRTVPGCEGEVVVTPLANRAMPLLRYRTGDRGLWLTKPCRCGRSSPRLRLTTGRRPSRLVTAAGATVNVVRFAKLLAALNVEQYAFHQTAAGTVVVSYRAGRPLDQAGRSLVEASVRAALGPATLVRLERVARLDPPQRPATRGPVANADAAEPGGPDLDDMARWLRATLAGEPGLELAVLTGSALDVEAVTRFSDMDLVLLFRGEVPDAGWVERARQLRLHVPRLSIGLQPLAGLARRAPLLTCRLLREQLLVLGRLDESVLDWPSVDALRAEGRFWAQAATLALWQRLTNPEPRPVDPVQEAWVASKYVLNALRYRYLLHGACETAARAILERARHDPQLASARVAVILEAFDVAREHRPPPLAEAETVTHYLAAALDWVRSTAAVL